MPTAPNYRKTRRRGGGCLIAMVLLTLTNFCDQTVAQTGFSATPQTNLGPIGAPSGVPGAMPGTGPNAFSGGYPSPGGNSGPVGPAFDPYANAAGGYGNATITPLGPPTPLGGPSYAPGAPLSSPGAPLSSPGAAGIGGNPSYPNGSLLGGLFSGNWFRGNSNSGVYQGAAYPNAGGFPLGTPSASAAQYDAGSIYGSPPPSVGSGPLYGNGSMLSPPGTSGFNTQSYGQSYNNPGVFGGYNDAYANGGYNNPFPPSAYPSGSPTSLFPGGLGGGGGGGGSLLPGGFFSGGGLSAYQLLHGPRLRHTFISGGQDQDALGVNQTDFSLGFAFGNFFYSNRPLYVVPSFSLYLFDGPTTTPDHGADLPGSAYGGFIDFGWQTDPNQIIGSEFGLRVGSYSDFDTFNEDSIRIMGKGLVSFRLTPNSTVKAGAYYLDRESVKILPAGGLLWQPDPYTRFDIFFPEPKFAKYWRTIGTQDVWWYLAGEYGGDSWTVTRANVAKTEERVDINQIGVTFGWEWGRSDLIRTGQRTAFIEFGGVFNRELKYEFSDDDQDLGEAFLVRAGWGY